MRYIKTKEIKHGKATIALIIPQHLIFIQDANEERLRDFIKFLHNISSTNETAQHLPTLEELKIPKPKSIPRNNGLPLLRNQFSPASQCTLTLKVRNMNNQF